MSENVVYLQSTVAVDNSSGNSVVISIDKTNKWALIASRSDLSLDPKESYALRFLKNYDLDKDAVIAGDLTDPDDLGDYRSLNSGDSVNNRVYMSAGSPHIGTIETEASSYPDEGRFNVAAHYKLIYSVDVLPKQLTLSDDLVAEETIQLSTDLSAAIETGDEGAVRNRYMEILKWLHIFGFRVLPDVDTGTEHTEASPVFKDHDGNPTRRYVNPEHTRPREVPYGTHWIWVNNTASTTYTLEYEADKGYIPIPDQVKSVTISASGTTEELFGGVPFGIDSDFIESVMEKYKQAKQRLMKLYYYSWYQDTSEAAGNAGHTVNHTFLTTGDRATLSTELNAMGLPNSSIVTFINAQHAELGTAHGDKFRFKAWLGYLLRGIAEGNPEYGQTTYLANWQTGLTSYTKILESFELTHDDEPWCDNLLDYEFQIPELDDDDYPTMEEMVKSAKKAVWLDIQGGKVADWKDGRKQAWQAFFPPSKSGFVTPGETNEPDAGAGQPNNDGFFYWCDTCGCYDDFHCCVTCSNCTNNCTAVNNPHYNPNN